MNNTENGADPCAYAHDAQLGWTSPPNCTSAGYNVDGQGFRKTPPEPTLMQPPVLVTGSSFAKGDEVSDAEAWPAYLQELLNRRVLNAGVGGYSLDQTVLRAEELVPRIKPKLIIVSFTPDDVRRNELKVSWSRAKPYFTVNGGRLELQNVPVPGHAGERVPIPTVAKLLGWSSLADLISERLSIFAGWYYDEVQGGVRGSGPEIACLLMQRLAKLHVPVVVVAEYSRGHWMADAAGKARDFAKTRPVLACAEKAGLVPLDMAEPLEPIMAKRGVDALFRTDHHSAEGNRATAEAIAQALTARRLAARSLDRP